MKINVESLNEACISCARLEIESVTSYANDQVYERWFACKHLADCENVKKIIENYLELRKKEKDNAI